MATCLPCSHVFESDFYFIEEKKESWTVGGGDKK